MNKPEFKKTARFVANGQRIAITFEMESRPAQEGSKDIDLKPVVGAVTRFSFTGECDGSSGQCDKDIREQAGDIAAVAVLLDLWEEYHLNDMRPGTRPQLAAIRDFYASKPEKSDYDAIKAYLESIGLLVDRGYSYGSAWLYDATRDREAIKMRVDALLTAVDGKRFGVAPDVDDAPDVSETDDTIDSRDVIKRIEIYRDAITAAGVDPVTLPDAFDPESREDGYTVKGWLEEFAALSALEEQCNYGDWRYGTTLIRDSYFEDYAREFADDIGAVNSEAKWPNSCIDWEAAADELKQDYTSVSFRGVDYWVRS